MSTSKHTRCGWADPTRIAPKPLPATPVRRERPTPTTKPVGPLPAGVRGLLPAPRQLPPLKPPLPEFLRSQEKAPSRARFAELLRRTTGVDLPAALPANLDAVWKALQAAKAEGLTFERAFVAWLLAAALPPLHAALVLAYKPGMSRGEWLNHSRALIVGTTAAVPAPRGAR